MAAYRQMKAKQQNIQKSSWQWAETVPLDAITQENIETAYRLKTKSCPQGFCRRNCKGNPYCLNSLGERFWLGEIQDEFWLDSEEPEVERREKKNFVGLRNLGATCYVNTFIQVWFQNIQFRQALYKYDSRSEILGVSAAREESTTAAPSDAGMNGITTADERVPPCSAPSPPQEQSADQKPCLPDAVSNGDISTQPTPVPDKEAVTGELKMPESICGQLQFLFAQLQHTVRRYLDPSDFIKTLGLATDQQQDAQEFCKLFTALLESTLEQQADPSVRNIVQEQFGGELFYVTRCHGCNSDSQRASKFFELDLNIQGHSKLSQCIEEFLKEEKLDGDNQYLCTKCCGKQDATRSIKLHTLPPVLNLQLLRFVFDRNTGCKKKLNSCIQFPDTLDLSEYMDASLPSESVTYQLTAVLIHKGPTAYSGHYMAHIRDRNSNTWYNFNDEEIEKIKGNKLQLAEEEQDGSFPSKSAEKKPKCAKGHYSSRNAYMLVYRRSTDAGTTVEPEPPRHILDLVEKDNDKFDEWEKSIKDMRSQVVKNGRRKQLEIQGLYRMAFIDDNDIINSEWVPVGWMRTWLSDKTVPKVPEIDNTSHVCPHGKLDPQKVGLLKCIRRSAADLLFEMYGGSVRLQGLSSLCRECVLEQCRSIQLRNRITEDQKVISKTIKMNSECSEGYWVGKRSLRIWRQLVNQETKQSPEGMKENGFHEDNDEDKDTKMETDNCNGEHTDSKLEEVFQNGESSVQTPECSTTSMETQDEDEDQAEEFNVDVLCIHDQLSTDTSSRRLIPDSVWSRLRYYFPSCPEFSHLQKECATCLSLDQKEQAEELMNRAQAQEQKNMLSQLYHDRNRPQIMDIGTSKVYAVSKLFIDNWRLFIKQQGRGGPPDMIRNNILLCPHNLFSFDPLLCGTDGADEMLCYVWENEWESLSKLYSVDQIIVISNTILIEEEHTTEDLTSNPAFCAECHQARIHEKSVQVLEYKGAMIYIRKITADHTEKDVQNILNPGESSSPKTDEGSQDPDFEGFPRKKQRLMSPETPQRRSIRHRRQRGEVVLKIDSSQTLREVKLLLMKQFSVMPMDQHLNYNGRTLNEDQATVSSLGIQPGSVLLLKVDEPQTEVSEQELLQAASTPEEGFKGTGLVGRSQP